MPRLRQVPRAEAAPSVQAVYTRLFGDRDPVTEPGTVTGTPGDWWGVFALVPEIFEHSVAGFALYRNPARALDPKLRELAQTRVGWACGSQFVFSQHCKSCRTEGIAEAKIAAIPHWSAADCFGPVERAVLAYTDALALDHGRVDDGVFDALRAELSDEEILELTYITALYMMHAVMSALRTEFDDRDEPVVEIPAPGDDQSFPDPLTSTTDLFSIRGKTALVTGGSRGIGLMIATGFVDAGASVYISSRKADVGHAVATELSSRGRCFSIPADLSTEAECRRLATELIDREERLDILVNNAGATWGAPLDAFDDAAWDRVLSLNVKGVFHLTKFLLPLLDAAGTADEPSRVINIGSIDGIKVPALETYSYSASKAAVHQLTRHLARRLAPRITVNAIAPGPFESKMMAATLETFGAEIAASAPLKRIGRPDDMAGAAIFLASRAGAYLTGAVIPVDGGIATVG